MVPLIVLISLNFLIFKKLKEHSILRYSLVNAKGLTKRKSSSDDTVTLSKLEIRMTRVSIIIVMIFIICHLPRIIPNVCDLILESNEKVIQYRIIVMNIIQGAEPELSSLYCSRGVPHPVHKYTLNVAK